MTHTVITWHTGETESFAGLGGFKSPTQLAKFYALKRQQYCKHSRAKGIKHPQCEICKKPLQIFKDIHGIWTTQR